MPRLFTGIEIPAEIAAELARCRGGLPDVRWVEPADYHLTLRFIGDVETDVAEDAAAMLAEARPREPIVVRIQGLGSFGGERPRSVHAEVAPDPALLELAAEQERLVCRAGLNPERRRFTPHITLARLRRSATADGVAAYLATQATLAPLRFTAERVVLYSARESRGGGPYVVEAAYPFA